MSDYVPADGTLDVSPEVHDFMNSLEYNPKISEEQNLLCSKSKGRTTSSSLALLSATARNLIFSH